MPAITTQEARRTRCALHPFDSTRTCIETDCMAWRWYYFTFEHQEHGQERDFGGGAARGYCGHAGPPQ